MNLQKKIINIGLFGGTFDPIHNGHITPIKKAAQQLCLDHIHLMPTNIPPHKSHTQSNSFHRSEMAKIVCQKEDLFSFDDRELKRNQASYTIDSLREIRQELTKENQAINLYFFMGADSLNNFPLWHQWQDILSLCHLVVMPRPGYLLNNALPDLILKNIIDCTSSQDILNTSIHNKLSTGNVFMMHDMSTDISSSHIRAILNDQRANEQVINKKTLLSMLPIDVYEYISKHKLYS